jgi:predicted XRE-type DNA-binding protein
LFDESETYEDFMDAIQDMDENEDRLELYNKLL